MAPATATASHFRPRGTPLDAAYAMTALHSDSYNEHLLRAQRLTDAPGPAGRPSPRRDASPPQSSADDIDDEDTFLHRWLGPLLAVALALLLLAFLVGYIPYKAASAAHDARYDEALYWTSGLFVLIAVPVSAHGIVQHLVNFYMPQVQKYVVRILCMVPIFSVQAWISLCVHDAAFYFRTFRELYEAFVLSSFVYYLIELLGGEDALAHLLRTKPAHHGAHAGPLRWCGDWEMGRPFLLSCKYGVLQYVLLKILFTFVVLTLTHRNLFNVGEWAWDSPYAYVAVLMNASIGYALYCLVKLYYATKDDLREYHPIGKFLCIKGIIFFTFWQGFTIEVLHSFGVIKRLGDWDGEHVVDGLQDFLLSFEMVLFAVAHRYAFPHTDYLHYLRRGEGKASARRRREGTGAADETLFLFDPDGAAVDNEDSAAVDVEYAPPSVRQLDRPLGVGRALLGAVPTETLSDIARMTASGSVVVGEGGGAAGGGADGGDILFSREHAEGI